MCVCVQETQWWRVNLFTIAWHYTVILMYRIEYAMVKQRTSVLIATVWNGFKLKHSHILLPIWIYLLQRKGFTSAVGDERELKFENDMCVHALCTTPLQPRYSTYAEQSGWIKKKENISPTLSKSISLFSPKYTQIYSIRL